MDRPHQFTMTLSDFERRELDRMAKARNVSASDVLRGYIRNERVGDKPPLGEIVLRVEVELTEDDKTRLAARKTGSWSDAILALVRS